MAPLNEGSPSESVAASLVNAIYLHSPEAIGVSVSGTHVMVNPSYVELFRLPDAAAIVGRPVLELVDPRDHARVRDYIQRRGQPGVPDRYEVGGRRHDGTHFDMEVRAAAYDEGGTTYTLVILRDVTERNDAQRALADSREFYRALFEVNTAVKLLIRPSTGQIVDANAAAAEFYGWPIEELRTRFLHQINTSPPETILKGMEEVRTRGRRYFEFRHRTASGATRDVEVYTGPVEVRGETLLLSIIHDTTDRKALEEQLRQAQKMEAVGRLAGGIAHDFNNLLMVMMGYGELATQTISPASPTAEALEGILAAAQRARDLTRQLLAFSRRQVLQPQVVALDRAVTDLEKILRRTLGPHIELRIHTAPGLPPTFADPGQLDQVILNLALNARDAMPKGGVLTITTGSPDAADPRVPLGAFVRLSVTDTGIGMDEVTRGRVFEPFFTTKPAGEGTGLGLATVYGIITQSGGHILVDSVLGAGSDFTVLLPVATDAAAAPPEAPTARAPARGHLLIVDDQEDVRVVLGELLRLAGFTVALAADADEAEALYAAAPDAVAGLITDVVMPGRSGVDLARALTATRPALPVLIISGDLRNHLIDPLPATWRFLQKPFARGALFSTVSELLGQGPTAGPDGRS